MNEILKKTTKAEGVIEYVVYNPAVAAKARPGQFVILIIAEGGERVPFTITDYDREKGTITLLVQTVGETTHQMSKMNVGDSLYAFVGPLGNATDLAEYNRVCLVGGGIGTAVIFPQAKLLKSQGKSVDVILGARDKDLLMYVDEFASIVDNLYLMTDNGSAGEKGFVTNKLQALIDNGVKYDVVFAVGPMIMMKVVSDLTRKYKIKTLVSMNTIMIDGTGMCGGCRVTVGGKRLYACVDGPEFDGHEVDYDEALNRLGLFKEQEQEAYCRLTGEKHGKKN